MGSLMTLSSSIESAKKSTVYYTYLEVRERVFKMLDQAAAHMHLTSNYWEEELAGFDYMFDASPLIIRKLREHCYHLTGLRSYEYRSHHMHQTAPFLKKLMMLRQIDSDNLFVPESPALGGFGHVIEGVLVNLDTLKFYESLIALNMAGLLTAFRGNSAERKIVMEIGAGWGGFAYQFKTLCPNTCYIIVDLPQTLLFSGVYLKTLFPSASVLFYGDKPTEMLLESYDGYDFIFIPHFFFGQMKLPKLDLAINMISFQEMTSEQIDVYVRGLAELACSNVYSHNRDRSPYNNQLTSVRSIIQKYYNTSEQKVFNVPYTDLSFQEVTIHKEISRSSKRIYDLALKFFKKSVTQQERSIHEYRHLFGTLKSIHLPHHGQ